MYCFIHSFIHGNVSSHSTYRYILGSFLWTGRGGGRGGGGRAGFAVSAATTCVFQVSLSSKTESQGFRQQCVSVKRHRKSTCMLLSTKLNRIRWLEMKTQHMHTISGARSKAKAHGSRAGATSPGVRALPDINTGHVQEGVPEINGTCTHAQTHVSHLRVHAVSFCCMLEVNGTCTHAQAHVSHLRVHVVSCCCMPEVNGTCTYAQTHVSHLRVHAVSCCCMPGVNGTCTHAQTHVSHLRVHAVSCCCMSEAMGPAHMHRHTSAI